ncbi:MAG: hypothetical protein HYS13_04205 [Planctomycetia bacterium]|nr:hypothetical protein [Planctomycetia bacterium]
MRLAIRRAVKFVPTLIVLAFFCTFIPAPAFAEERPVNRITAKRIAAIITVYHHNSHADVIVSRLLQTETLDGKGRKPDLKLVSLYTDQAPKNDMSRKLAKEHGFEIYDTIADALTLKTGKLAVDGVLLVAEHGSYPTSPTGQTQYPKRRFFEAILKVFDDSGNVVPIFCDKHLGDNEEDIFWAYEECRKRRIPLMAGSSLPGLWRYPPVDVPKGAKLKSIVAVSYHTLDAYGFHAVEMVQCLAERRKGGETGIASVQCLTGPAVWEAGEKGVYDPAMLDAALARLKRAPTKEQVRAVKEPVLFVINYADGLRASVFTLNYAVGEWAVAWRDDADKLESTLFYTQEARPFMHFTYLVRGIEEMMHTGKPTWPVERTLMTSAALDALLVSKKEGAKLLETPKLKISYQPTFDWQQPPDPPPDRPIDGQ